MSACIRCGVDLSATYYDADSMTECLDQVTCARRELANLRSLLRSVTLKLESIREAFGDDGLTYLDAEDTAYIGGQIDEVLEALS